MVIRSELRKVIASAGTHCAPAISVCSSSSLPTKAMFSGSPGMPDAVKARVPAESSAGCLSNGELLAGFCGACAKLVWIDISEHALKSRNRLIACSGFILAMLSVTTRLGVLCRRRRNLRPVCLLANEKTSAQGRAYFWRREWDSNPRWTCIHGSFQDCCLKPLGHLSRNR